MEIVATYVPSTRGHAEELSDPPAGATMIELRADLLDAGCDLAALVAVSPRPVIVTLRSRAEGGNGPEDPAERRRFFKRASVLPAVLFDLEAERAEFKRVEYDVERTQAEIREAGLPEQLAGRLSRGI